MNEAFALIDGGDHSASRTSRSGALASSIPQCLGVSVSQEKGLYVRVIIPKPVSIKEETNINIREASFESVFTKFYLEDCNEKGKQKANLSKTEMSGLAKLRKRVENGTIVMMETDKSGKFAVASIDAYIEIGKVHISQDKEIHQSEVDSKV